MALLLATQMLTGCVVDVDTTPGGKPCPCPDGFSCDAATETCTSTSSCEPGVRLSESGLTAQWETPHTIRWQWQPLGDAGEFDHYRLILGHSREEVETNAATARVFDASSSPELGFIVAPGNETDNAATVTDGLTPFDPLQAGVGRYFGKLEIADRAGCTFTSDIVEDATERAKACDRVVFEDELVLGVSPPSLEVGPDCGVAGSACLLCTASGGCSTASGWSIALEYDADLSQVTENDMATGRAFLQLALALSSSEPSYFASVGIAVLDGDGVCEAEPSWSFDELFLRASQPIADQQLEIPLNQLVNRGSGEALTYADTSAMTMCAFHIGAGASLAGDVLIDDVAGCW